MADMNILAIEAATSVISVAIETGDTIHERVLTGPAARAEELLRLVQEVLAAAGVGLEAVQGVAFGRGPGAFTGLRMAAAIAQGLAYPRGWPVAPVSSLAALAEEAPGDAILAALDARRDEVYAGVFRRRPDGLVHLVGRATLSSPEAVRVPEDVSVGVGSGCDHYGSRMRACALTFVPGCVPRARAIARLAQPLFRDGLSVPAAAALPVYLRDDVADGPQGLC